MLQRQKALEEKNRAIELEAMHRERREQIELSQRKLLEDKHDESLCKEAWRKSKYDTAQQVAALQLEHHARQAIEKEKLRLNALKGRESRYNLQSEMRRLDAEQRSKSVMMTLTEQQNARGEQEAQKQLQDMERHKAFLNSLKEHRMNLSLRGKQKQIEIMRKKSLVRKQVADRIDEVMDKAEKKMSYFLHSQLDKQRQDEEALKLRQEEAKNEQKRLFVQLQAEKRKEQLLERIAEDELRSKRAAERKANEDMINAEKLLIRQEEIQKAQERLHKIEQHRVEMMHEKMELDNQRMEQIREDRQSEMDMVRRIKQATLLKQHELKEFLGGDVSKKRNIQNNILSPLLNAQRNFSAPHSSQSFENSKSPPGRDEYADDFE